MYNMDLQKVLQARPVRERQRCGAADPRRCKVTGRLSDEEQAKFAADEAAKVDDVWSGIFGSADNSIVIPEDDGNSGFNMEGDFEGLDGEPVIGG